jgi:hypothetical protein
MCTCAHEFPWFSCRAQAVAGRRNPYLKNFNSQPVVFRVQITANKHNSTGGHTVQSVQGDLLFSSHTRDIASKTAIHQPGPCIDNDLDTYSGGDRFESRLGLQLCSRNSYSIMPNPLFLNLICETIGTAASPGLLCQPRVIVKMIVEN